MSTRVNGLRKWIVTFYQLFRHYVYPIRRDPISILDLDLDILWTIFTINADIDDPGALNSTLMTSQVCSSWHNLLLTTPSIWGRLLNLDVLSKGGNIRPAEILRRSGSSSLWIKADITGAPHLKEFFFNIVDQHWQRIKYLDISLPSNLVTFERWNVFCLPAPHLETFKVCIRHTGGLTRRGLHQVAHTWSNSHHLFANEAPMLREFYVTQYKFDHPPGWVTRLSALRIGYPFTLQEALFAVQEIPNLESFVIGTLKVTVNPDTIQRLPHIYPTKLNFCALYGYFEESITLLQHLEVPSNCRLSFVPCHVRSSGIPRDFFKSLIGMLSTFCQRYFRQYKSLLHLLYSSRHFELREILNRRLNFEIIIGSVGEFPAHLQTLLFHEFALPVFSKVPGIFIKLGSPVPKKSFMSFLYSFSSCRYLMIQDEATIRNLHKFYDDIEAHGGTSVSKVPNIMYLALEFWHPTSTFIGENGALHRFLKDRMKRGRAIKVLSLRYSHATPFPSLQYLEEIFGLRVSWTEPQNGVASEYKCGSGHPEKLPRSLG